MLKYLNRSLHKGKKKLSIATENKKKNANDIPAKIRRKTINKMVVHSCYNGHKWYSKVTFYKSSETSFDYLFCLCLKELSSHQ